jgi:hypothetical protein
MYTSKIITSPVISMYTGLHGCGYFGGWWRGGGVVERNLERYFREKAKKVGGISYKLATNTVGIPDRIFFFKGLCYLVELKDDNGRLSQIQKLRISEIKQHYDKVYVLKGKNEIINFFRGVVDNGIT